MAEQQENRPVKTWVPLEANPDVWNEIIHNAGVDSSYNFVDVYGFDPELLAMIPQPVKAIVFLFPITEAYEKYKEEEEAHLIKLEQNISPDVVFFKQTIENSCGMVALLHAVANNDDNITSPGLFSDIIQQAKNMSIEERVELLESSDDLEKVHKQAANEGETEAPSEHDPVDLHFICFVEVDQHLYELDGRKLFPINHGKCKNLVDDTVTVMKRYMARDPEETNFSAIAFCKTNE